MRYPASEKLEIIRLVEQSHLPVRQTVERLGCKIARNFDPTFKVSQRIDLVAKYWNWEVHLSRPIVTPPEKWILTSNQ